MRRSNAIGEKKKKTEDCQSQKKKKTEEEQAQEKIRYGN